MLLSTLVSLCLLTGSASADHIEMDADTIMLDNVSGGSLIDRLVSAGYDDESLFKVLQDLQPYSGGAISPSFMTLLAGTTDSDALDAVDAATSNFTDFSNNPIGIGIDGGLIVAAVYGDDYDGQPGYTTFSNTIPGLGTVHFTSANDPDFYIAAGARYDYGTKARTTYWTTAIIWAAPDAAATIPEPSSVILVGIGLAGAAMRRLCNRRK
jgi:hypothetical protein